MRVASKQITLMGGNYTLGGVALSLDNKLFVVVNEANKLVCLDFTDPKPGPDAILYSTNAFGYAPFCNVRSITYMGTTGYNPSVIMLLENGEIWQKDLTTKEEIKWADPAWAYPYPQCRGAAGIEFQAGAIYVAFPQKNVVQKLSLGTLQLLAEYSMGLPSSTSYPPTALTKDNVTDRWVTIDPVKGDIVYGNPLDFTETSRERYTYGIYNTCFNGDIAWAKTALPSAPDKDFFVVAVGKQLIVFTEPWYKLYEVDDVLATYKEVDGILFDNAEVGEDLKRHLRLENKTDRLRQGMTITVQDDPTRAVDDALTLSTTPVGPWARSISVGDLSANGVKDFYLRFFPQSNVELGTFTVQLVIDWQGNP